MAKGVSVIICCYNSADRLPQTLQHLAQQQTGGSLQWEVIVVDNASTDATTTVAASMQNSYTQPGLTGLRVIAEPRPGLSYARHTGMAAANYEYIVFCDDDNWLDKNYVQQVSRLLDAHPGVGVLGGNSEAVSSIPLPEWFSQYQEFYAVGPQAASTGDVGERNFVFGAGMALRKSVYRALQKAGFPSLLTDRTGNNLVSGGDVEICYIHRLAGFGIWYDESLFFRHFMSPARLTPSYLERLKAGALQGVHLLQPYYPLLRLKQRGWLTRTALSAYYVARSAAAFVLKRDALYHLSYAEAYNGLPFAFHKQVKQIKKAMQVKIPQANNSI